MAHIVEQITLEAVRAAKPEMIFYAMHTCWWTHDPKDVAELTGSRIPCDPRGSVLFEAHDPEKFLRLAEENPEHYGRHGLRAFIAAHHQNCRVSASDHRSTSMRTWPEYNDAIDAKGDRDQRDGN